jgi:hypothetical protein
MAIETDADHRHPAASRNRAVARAGDSAAFAFWTGHGYLLLVFSPNWGSSNVAAPGNPPLEALLKEC